MKNSKKVAAIVLVICIVASIVTVAVRVYNSEDKVSVTITTDKTEYSSSDSANITVTVKNGTKQKLTGAVISVKADKWLLADGSNSNVLKIGNLGRCRKKVLNLVAVPDDGKADKGTAFEDYSDNGKSSTVASSVITHDGATVTIVATIWYNPNEKNPDIPVAKTEDIESYSDALSELVNEQESEEFVEEAVLENEYYSSRVLVKTAELDLMDYVPSAVIESTNDIYVVQFDNEDDARSFCEAQIENPDTEFAEPDSYLVTSDIVEGWGTEYIEVDKKLQDMLNPSADDDTESEEEPEEDESSATEEPEGIEESEGIEEAEAVEKRKEIIVAVVDTGIDVSHPDLAGKIADGGFDYVDNDNDPSVGSDEVEMAEAYFNWCYRLEYGVDASGEDLEYIEDMALAEVGHGTHVAGIIAQCTQNLDIKILPVRTQNIDGSGYNSVAAAGIMYAAEYADVINLSIGSGKSSVLDYAVEYAISKGVTCCVAAGNDNIDTAYCSPSGISTPGCICTAAIDSTGTKAYFSNYGASVDVCAPGVDIVSCVPCGYYMSLDGTSMAAPFTSACAAIYIFEHEGATPEQVENGLTRKVLDLGDLGWDEYYGYGAHKLVTGTVVKGEIIEFGSYPQTEVDDADLIIKLNALEADWKSYGYFSGSGKDDDGKMVASDYMKYCDVTYEGEKYRGVTFTSYRPSSTGGGRTLVSSVQDENGYYKDDVYWFRYEPIKWIVLDSANGIVVCKDIIDAQAYNNYNISDGTDENGNTIYRGDADKKYYSNDYYRSSIRKWLLNDFYNTAFNDTEKENLVGYKCDNSAFDDEFSIYNSKSSTDKVFLLSYNETEKYISGSPVKAAQGSDYAKCQGLNFMLSVSKAIQEKSEWLLRSAGTLSNTVCVVSRSGELGSNALTNHNKAGVRPVIRLAEL